MTIFKTCTPALAVALSIIGLALASRGQAPANHDSGGAETAILARMGEIQNAAEALDADRVFSFVLDNDQGALIQNGRFLLTRQDALEATRNAFAGLEKVAYRFDQQRVKMIGPTVALVTGEGTTSATTKDGQTIDRRFAQSVVMVLTGGEWKVLHAHRSFPVN